MTGDTTGWPDLVTTALLGTGRRPLPTTLPESWAGLGWAGSRPSGPDGRETSPEVHVLELAVRHRALRRAATRPSSPPPVPLEVPAPPADRPPPPAAATVVLASLLVRPVPALVNFWLGCADTAGCGAPAEHWTRLARLAAHSTAYDRPLLGRVLGERGRWFLRQNPEWRRLASDATSAPRPAQRGTPDPPGGSVPPTAEAVRSRPSVIFDHPDPWPDSIVAAAYAVLGGGGLGRAAREFAAGVGARLPLTLYEGLGAAAAYYLQAPEASPALRRQIRAAFVSLEEAAFVRARIEHAFRPDEATDRLRRIEIPNV